MPFTLILLLVGISQFPVEANAWPPTYGSEFNFSNEWIIAGWKLRYLKSKFQRNAGLRAFWQAPGYLEKRAMDRFARAVEKKCQGECTLERFDYEETMEGHARRLTHSYTVTFGDGYKFEITMDPAVVEIKTSPETLQQVQHNENRAQKFIFDIAKSVGLSGSGSAHLNVGLKSAFQDDHKGFLRFYTNYQNNAELTSGILGLDFDNAPSLNHLPKVQKEKLMSIVADVNRDFEKVGSLNKVIRAIQDEVHFYTPFMKPAKKFQAISVKSAVNLSEKEDGPFELRGPRQPASAKERTLLIELIEKRMQFEKDRKDLIVYLNLPKKNYSNDELANRFRIYLAEMDAEWDHFSVLLPKSLRSIKADSFISGTFKWSSKADLEIMQAHLPNAASSPWVRERLKTYLIQPEALVEGRGEAMLSHLLEMSKGNRDMKASVNSFIDDLKTNPAWKEITLTPKLCNLKRTLLEKIFRR